MDFFCNELSVERQFVVDEAFVRSLRQVWSIRQYLKRQNIELRCRHGILDRHGAPNSKFRDMLNSVDRELKRSVLAWLQIDHELPLDTDGEVVDINVCGQVIADSVFTDLIYHHFITSAGSIVSFSPSPTFADARLSVEAKVGGVAHSCTATNLRTLEDIKVAVPIALPRTWEGYLTKWRDDFPNLKLAHYLERQMQREPFELSTASAVTDLLATLDRLQELRKLMRNARIEGDVVKLEEHRLALDRLHSTHFRGDRPRFTDESATNKDAFKSEMTFPHPDGDGTLFCSYHGKSSHRFWRLHYSWPLEDEEPMYVVYIGPKITKS